MNDSLRTQIRNNLNQKETDVLVKIWKNHDDNEWTELAFDVVREILRDRQVELPSQDEPSHPRFSAEVDQITDIGELERKIKDGETLLLQAESKGTAGWITILISLGIVVAMAIKIPGSGVYVVITGFGLLYLGINIWRLYCARKQKKEIESELKEYRDKKAELQTTLNGKE